MCKKEFKGLISAFYSVHLYLYDISILVSILSCHRLAETAIKTGSTSLDVDAGQTCIAEELISSTWYEDWIQGK